MLQVGIFAAKQSFFLFQEKTKKKVFFMRKSDNATDVIKSKYFILLG